MDFQQQDFGLRNWNNDKFQFKKSILCFENLLLCLGSNIVAQNINGKAVQTTLFQDKLVDGVISSLIEVDRVAKT